MTSLEKIKKLRHEVYWTNRHMLSLIFEWILEQETEDRTGVLRLLLENTEHLSADEILQFLITKANFYIKLDNTIDRGGCVLVEASSRILAEHDQTIAGSRWEFPRDMDIAYAMPGDHPGLLEELTKEGYIIDDSEYSPPEKCHHNKSEETNEKRDC